MKPIAPRSDPRRPSLLQAWQALVDDLPGLVSDRAYLMALELRRARYALVQIVSLLLAAAVLVGVAWLLLCMVVAIGAVESGWSWISALGLVLLVNIGLGILALRRAGALVSRLSLPATLRKLTATAEAVEPAGVGPAEVVR
jgi:hypothetical protein